MAAATCYELVLPMRSARGVHAGPQVRRGQPRPPLIHAHYSDQRSAIMVSAISRGVAPTFGLETRLWVTFVLLRRSGWSPFLPPGFEPGPG